MSPKKSSVPQQTRVKWCEEKTGADIIVDFVDGEWKFFERECGGTQWYPLKEPTPEMLKKFESMRQQQHAA